MRPRFLGASIPFFIGEIGRSLSIDRVVGRLIPNGIALKEGFNRVALVVPDKSRRKFTDVE